MIDEQYINGTYFKRYSGENNKDLLFLLPGQTMSPRAFWDIKLPEGKTHSEYFFEAGLDVILFDPVGYGKSKEFYNYDRVSYAQQIKSVTDTLTKEYRNKTILGFSTSTAPAAISSTHGYFNKLAFHSPCIRAHDKIVEYQEIFTTSIELLKAKRLKDFGDRLMPKANRVDNWEQSLMEVLKTNTTYDNGTWSVPGQIVRDIDNYYTINKTTGIDYDKMPEDVFSVHGQYDFEMMKFGCEILINARPNLKVVVVPDSSHFSMWENNNHITRKAIIDFTTNETKIY